MIGSERTLRSRDHINLEIRTSWWSVFHGSFWSQRRSKFGQYQAKTGQDRPVFGVTAELELVEEMNKETIKDLLVYLLRKKVLLTVQSWLRISNAAHIS